MISLDTVAPVTFKTFKNYYSDLTNASELNDLYSKYLVEFTAAKATKETNTGNYTSNLYKEYIKNVDLSYLKTEINTYLSRIDYNDVYDLETIVNYISDTIRKDAEKIRDYREELKFASIKNNLKASKEGISLYLKNVILRFISQRTQELLNKNIPVDLGKISNSLRITLNSFASNKSNNNEFNTPIDVLDRTDINQKIKNTSKTTLQALKVRHNGKSLYLNTSNKRKVSVNELYTDPLRLPERYFANEKKTIDNLAFTYNSKLSEKYLETDMYKLSGDSSSFSINKILTSENGNSYYNRYNPKVGFDYGSLIRKDKLPTQLSFYNTGLAISLSKNLTYNVDLSATNGEYIIPDPNKVQPGIGKGRIKYKSPVKYYAENRWVKNNEESSSISVRDNSSLKGFGYQSKESSLKYNATGINKQTDEVSFWTGSEQVIWKNSDVYKRENLNQYPESERYLDLLIKNETPIIIKSDLYGNEFALYKGVNPKRLASSTYTLYDNIYNNGTVTSSGSSDCTLYDGLYFEDVLQAISDGDSTSYPSASSVFDTLLFNDTSACSGATEFFAPLSTTECSLVTGDDVVDNGSFSDTPIQGINIAVDYFKKSADSVFNNVSVPAGFTTTYELTSLNNPSVSSIPLYDQKFTNQGGLFVREIKSQKVYTFYERLSGVFGKLSTAAQSAISANEVVNFDIIGNTIFIQTSANTFTESYTYDGENFEVSVPSNSII